MAKLSEMREDVNQKKEEVNQLAHRVQHRVDEITDWRQIVEERPFLSFGVAMGAGLLLSGVLGPAVKGTARMATNQFGLAMKASLTGLIASAVTNKMNNHGHA